MGSTVEPDDPGEFADYEGDYPDDRRALDAYADDIATAVLVLGTPIREQGELV